MRSADLTATRPSLAGKGILDDMRQRVKNYV